MGVLYQAKKKLRKNEWFWRNVFNSKASASFNSSSIPAHIRPLIVEMRANGICKTNINYILQDDAWFSKMKSRLAELEDLKKNQIAEMRQLAGDKSLNKAFMQFLLDEKPKLDKTKDEYIFSTLPEIKSLANGYFQMNASLKYLNFWHNLITSGEAMESQLWHRDREDLQIFKFFLYFTNVDEGGGPFTYAPGTHILGNVKKNPEYTIQKGVSRTSDEQMDALVPRGNWVVATGSPGDVIIADTHGYHRGGLCRTSERMLFTCMYTSPACDRVYFS